MEHPAGSRIAAGARRALVVLALFVSACGGGGDGGAGPSAAPPPPPPPPPPAGSAQVAVTVIDTLGRFVPSALVAAGTSSTATDATGRATIVVATGAEQAVAINKDGFADQVKVMNLATGTTTSRLDTMLIAREAAQSIATIEAGGSTSGRHGVRVTFPANALVNAAGQAVTGTVQMSMTPVDVGDVDVGAFPGLFEGVPTGAARTAIVSYGTSELVPQQNGQRLQLAAGRTAQIELPLYSTRLQNGSTVAAGDSIPLWSLDMATGVWRQEGSATVVASAASPTGLAGRATISHFSWWNLDHIAERARVNVTVNAPGVTFPADTRADVAGNVVAGTGLGLTATTTIAIGTTTQLQVAAGVTTRIEATAQFGTGANAMFCRGSVDVSPANNATVDATINMVCVTLPTATLVRPAGTFATNSAAPVSFQIVVDGPTPDTVELLADGNVVATFGPQFFYRGFLETTSLAEGTIALTPRVSRQGVTRTGNTVSMVVDRTRPELTGQTPEPGTDVSQTTVFTLDFSEPVNPLPFALTDAVKLAVTPIGASNPIEIPIDVALSTDGQQLTVRAQRTLPLGTLSLTWGGLKDAAANAVANPVAATFAIDRAVPLLAIPQQLVNFGPPLAINAAGQLIAAWVEADNNLRVAVHNGTAFATFGAPADNPTSSAAPSNFRYDMTLDANDLPLVVYTRASPPTDSLVVRRFDGTNWQDVGPAFTGIAAASSDQPRLLIDALARPVLAFTRNNRVEVFRFEPGAGTWTPLGVPAAVLTATAVDLRFDLALLPNGDPVVALSQGIDTFNNSHLKAARHNGSTWVPLGGVLAFQTAGGQIGQPRIAGGANGPWVHYVKSGNELRLLRFNGADWEAGDVPRPANAVSLQNPNALGLLNDDPVVVWNDFSLGVFVTRFTAGQFDPAFPAIGRPSQLSIAIRNTAAGPVAFIGAQPFSGLLIVERALFP